MRFFLLIAGFLSLALAILGIFLPILPTTPFLLLSALLFSKSSQKWYNYLLQHKIFGKYITDFQVNRVIPLRVKIYSISFLWITILASAIFAVSQWWLRVLLVIIAIAVTIHILSFAHKRDNH